MRNVQPALFSLDRNCAGAVLAVSYTHLDVYKRQVLDHIGRSKAQVEQVRDQVQEILRKLKTMQDETCLLYTSRCV